LPLQKRPGGKPVVGDIVCVFGNDSHGNSDQASAL
jgi:hypothetical protein